jgi:hypothetical protein
LRLFKVYGKKICFYCGSLATIKNGKIGGIQRYKCRSCKRQFLGRKKIDTAQLYSDYLFGKQTVEQLSKQYKKSSSTIRRRLDEFRSKRIVSSDKYVVLLMDATYWGRGFGVVVMKDARTKKILWRKFINGKETLSDYKEGVDWLVSHQFVIEGIVCDGLRGMFSLFSVYRVQMCQFHQVQIVKRYLTSKPELEASKELLSIAKMLCHTDKESFMGIFEQWSDKWSGFLKERTKDRRTGKSRYTHGKLRSAYLSIKRNMPYLWTWYDNYEIGIPNTNNALEGKFTDLKTKLRNHNGLSREHRKVFIDEYFRATFC